MLDAQRLEAATGAPRDCPRPAAGDVTPVARILELQRSVGNQAVVRQVAAAASRVQRATIQRYRSNPGVPYTEGTWLVTDVLAARRAARDRSGVNYCVFYHSKGTTGAKSGDGSHSERNAWATLCAEYPAYAAIDVAYGVWKTRRQDQRAEDALKKSIEDAATAGFKILSVYTERAPCGSDYQNCEGFLQAILPLDSEVYWSFAYGNTVEHTAAVSLLVLSDSGGGFANVPSETIDERGAASAHQSRASGTRSLKGAVHELV